MIYDNFEIVASPCITRTRCPKCLNDTIELDDGWFSQCWWCKKCEKLFTLKMVEMIKYNEEEVDKQLKSKV